MPLQDSDAPHYFDKYWDEKNAHDETKAKLAKAYRQMARHEKLIDKLIDILPEKP